MTIRIDPELLISLKERAKHEGRSVSAEVVRMIRNNISPMRAPQPSKYPTMGMFASFDAPDLEDFRSLRRDASKRLRRLTKHTAALK